jgi:hypothetical protein
LKKEKKDKDEQMRVKVRLNKDKELLEREHLRKTEEKDKQKVLNLEMEAIIERLQLEYDDVLRQKEQSERLKIHSANKVNEIITET